MTAGAAAALAFGLAAAGYAAGWLTARGGGAAGLVGTATLWGLGLSGALVLGLFFVSGSLLTAWNGRRNREPGAARRTARQVLANGAWAAAGAVLARVDAVHGWTVFTGALVAAQSDTWATEIGRRAGHVPRLITSGAPVPPGTSGGVTVPGTAGGLLGGLLLSGLAWFMGAPGPAALGGLLGGLTGMMADSVLGATMQARFRCAPCQQTVETAVHHGEPAMLVRGWRWLDNDAVNLLACSVGAAGALLVGWTLARP